MTFCIKVSYNCKLADLYLKQENYILKSTKLPEIINHDDYYFFHVFILREIFPV